MGWSGLELLLWISTWRTEYHHYKNFSPSQVIIFSSLYFILFSFQAGKKICSVCINKDPPPHLTMLIHTTNLSSPPSILHIPPLPSPLHFRSTYALSWPVTGVDRKKIYNPHHRPLPSSTPPTLNLLHSISLDLHLQHIKIFGSNITILYLHNDICIESRIFCRKFWRQHSCITLLLEGFILFQYCL